jgi:hypothetical protein
MTKPFQNEQKKAAAAAEIKDTLWRAAMKFQILDALAIDPQPVIDIRIFCIARTGITFFNLTKTTLINTRENGPKRKAKNGTLRPAPSAPISFPTS